MLSIGGWFGGLWKLFHPVWPCDETPSKFAQKSIAIYRLRIERNVPIHVIALWAAVQPAKSLILGTSGLIDPPGPRLRPPDLYIIRKLSERRIRLSNNTNFDNVALNAKFIIHAHDLLIINIYVPRIGSSTIHTV